MAAQSGVASNRGLAHAPLVGAAAMCKLNVGQLELQVQNASHGGD